MISVDKLYSSSLMSLFMLGVFVLCSCTTPQRTQKSAGISEKLNAMATEKFATDFELHYNDEKTAVAVCHSSKRHPQDPMSDVQVMVLTLPDLTEQIEEVVVNCSKYFWKGGAFVVVEVPGIAATGKPAKARERTLYRIK